MTNEQLAMSLINTFRPFGEILSVKASRDGRGRPFGFVDFKEPYSANEAIKAAPYLHINYRQVRVEIAKCQRKLCVRKPLSIDTSEPSINEEMKRMKSILHGYTSEDSVKMSVYQTPTGDAAIMQPVLSAILKFTDSKSADKALTELEKMDESWSVSWLTNERDGNCGIRQSGLVHIVPSKLGHLFTLPPIYIPQLSSQAGYYAPEFTSVYPAYAPLPSYELLQPRKQISDSQSIYEEQLLEVVKSGSPDITKEFENVSIKSDGLEKNVPEHVLSCTIFVGRLNSQKIGKDLLIEHFGKYGSIRYVCLFNKGICTLNGVPLDAYAFVTYSDKVNASSAIKIENGSVWLGQTIKCEHARVLPPTPSVVQLYHQSEVVSD